MALPDKTLKLCNCNGTLPLDARALAAALKSGTPLKIHSELCRKEVAAFNGALQDAELLVGCTQEAPLFAALAQAADAPANLRFVNIREAAGWSAEGAGTTPKIAALLATAALPDAEPVPNVGYKSAGQLLVIGPSGVALDWAVRLAEGLEPSVLITRADGGELPLERRFAVWSGKPVRIAGWLGAFEVEWTQDNPLDLDLCTRCNACIDACPEQAIDFSYQIDLGKCKAHRKCVAACGSVGAIDFSRPKTVRRESFDLVLDLNAEPFLRTPDLPQGYLAPGNDPLQQALAAAKLAQLVGEFEKPRFFHYKAKICAHSRSGVAGCSRCLDVCSTGAIRADGDHVQVEPHLCAGCGGCATVCPSGAMTYAYPGMPDMGTRLKTLLGTYREAGGRDGCVVFHDAQEGRALVHGAGRRAVRGGRGLPARAMPLEVFHIAAVGLDLMLGAVSYGASQVLVVAPAGTHDAYVAALEEQMRVAQAILSGLGYEGRHFALLRAGAPADLERQLWALQAASAPDAAATFNLSAEKRTTLDYAIDHLAKHAPRPSAQIPLFQGAPFGALKVNKEACTLCKACIGACPEAALLDAPDAPRLRFIERNCVQCGLCAKTCPEHAIALEPRLLIGAGAKEATTLNEDQPFACVKCGNPFATRRMIANMTARLGAHAMFAAGGAARRLQMCGDCRVIDMAESRDEPSILDYAPKK